MAFALPSLVPPAAMVWMWVVFNLLMVVAVPMFALAIIAPTAPRWARVEITLLFVCWSGSKVLTQYSLLTWTLGLAAMRVADARPLLSGAALGLALMKPQIAFPMALWFVLAGRWRTLMMATTVVGAGSLVYAARARVNPLDVAIGYVGILQRFYTGREALDGTSSLRPLLEAFASPESAELAAAGVSLLMLALTIGLARRLRRDDRLITLALGGVWSLSTLYHLTYGFILLLPAAILLRLDSQRRTQASRIAMFGIMQAGLIVDLPGVARRVTGVLAPVIVAAVEHADRLLMILVFAAVLWFAPTREEASAAES